LILTSKQGADRFLVTGKIAGQPGQEAIRALMCGFAIGLAAICTTRFVNKAAQRLRGSPRLRCKPFPMTRQQHHFARDHAKFWSASRSGRAICQFAPRCRKRLEFAMVCKSRNDFRRSASKVEVDHRA